jgi:ankyrin repeat protein
MNALEEHLFAGNVIELELILKKNRELSSKPISLPGNPTAKAHPLHRICDAVFLGNYSEEIGVAIANIFFKYGANVNPNLPVQRDSPLTAASSLGCDQLALLYIQQGANANHQGCHGGTALHWAAWCGRDVLVEKLIHLTSNINQLCIDFKSTPLFWAVHGLKFGGRENQRNQVQCAKILVDSGADTSIANFEGYLPIQLLNEDDVELRNLLSKKS